MNVIILEVQPKSWFTPLSYLIRAYHSVFGNGKMSDGSHFAICFSSSSTGNSMVLDATHNSVRMTNIYSFLEKYDVVRQTDVNIQFHYNDFASWYESVLGEPYGYLQYIGIIAKLRWLGNGIICNELVLKFLHRFTAYTDDYIDIRDLNYTRKVVSENTGD